MTKSSQFISSLMTVVLGVLFVILENKVVEIALTVFGVILLISAVLELIKFKIFSGVIKAVLGIAVLVFGWWFIDIALLVIGIVLIAFGALEFIKRIIALVKKNNTKVVIIVIK